MANFIAWKALVMFSMTFGVWNYCWTPTASGLDVVESRLVLVLIPSQDGLGVINITITTPYCYEFHSDSGPFPEVLPEHELDMAFLKRMVLGW